MQLISPSLEPQPQIIALSNLIEKFQSCVSHSRPHSLEPVSNPFKSCTVHVCTSSTHWHAVQFCSMLYSFCCSSFRLARCPVSAPCPRVLPFTVAVQPHPSASDSFAYSVGFRFINAVPHSPVATSSAPAWCVAAYQWTIFHRGWM